MLLETRMLANFAALPDAGNAQIGLAWILHQPNTVVIPRSTQPPFIVEYPGAIKFKLDRDDLDDLDCVSPAPDQPVRLGFR